MKDVRCISAVKWTEVKDRRAGQRKSADRLKDSNMLTVVFHMKRCASVRFLSFSQTWKRKMKKPCREFRIVKTTEKNTSPET